MAIFSALGSLLGGNAAASGAKQGASFAKGIWDTTKKNFQPWIDQGHNVVNTMGNVLGINGEGTTSQLAPYQQMGLDRVKQQANPFDPNEIGKTYTQSPGYQQQLDQGQQAINASASARGDLLSGATLKDAEKFSQGLANKDYWNYVNQVQSGQQQDAQQRQQQFQNIFGVSGQGLQASGNEAQAGASLGGTVAKAYSNAGKAQGQGISGAFSSIGKVFNPFAKEGAS